MSPSRSDTTVTCRAPLARKPAAASAASSQRRLCLLSNPRDRRRPFRPPDRCRISACTKPSNAPLSASTAIVGCAQIDRFPPSSRKLVVSWTAKTCKPFARRAVAAPAVATISSTLTLSLRRKRVSRISPARSPPRVRTAIPRCPTSTSRRCKKAPLFPTGNRRSRLVQIPSLASTPRINQRKGISDDLASQPKKAAKMCECLRLKAGVTVGVRVMAVRYLSPASFIICVMPARKWERSLPEIRKV
jgi:hypothetical protein